MQLNEITQSLNAAGVPVRESEVAGFLKSNGVKASEINESNIAALIEHFQELVGMIVPAQGEVATVDVARSVVTSSETRKGRSKKSGSMAKVVAQPLAPVSSEQRQQERQQIQSGIGQGLARQAQEVDQLATMIETASADLAEAGAYRIHSALANITPNAAALALQAIEEGQVDAGFFCNGFSQHAEAALALVTAGAEGQE